MYATHRCSRRRRHPARAFYYSENFLSKNSLRFVFLFVHEDENRYIRVVPVLYIYNCCRWWQCIQLCVIIDSISLVTLNNRQKQIICKSLTNKRRKWTKCFRFFILFFILFFFTLHVFFTSCEKKIILNGTIMCNNMNYKLLKLLKSWLGVMGSDVGDMRDDETF